MGAPASQDKRRTAIVAAWPTRIGRARRTITRMKVDLRTHMYGAPATARNLVTQRFRDPDLERAFQEEASRQFRGQATNTILLGAATWAVTGADAVAALPGQPGAHGRLDRARGAVHLHRLRNTGACPHLGPGPDGERPRQPHRRRGDHRHRRLRSGDAVPDRTGPAGQPDLRLRYQPLRADRRRGDGPVRAALRGTGVRRRHYPRSAHSRSSSSASASSSRRSAATCWRRRRAGSSSSAASSRNKPRHWPQRRSDPSVCWRTCSRPTSRRA